MKLPVYVSEATKRRNPSLYPLAGLQSPKSKPDSGDGSQGTVPRKEEGKSRLGTVPKLRVTFIRVCRRTITDSDNLPPAYKWTRDAIAASLGRDDRDDLIQWEYHQLQTRGREGTIVKIELL